MTSRRMTSHHLAISLCWYSSVSVGQTSSRCQRYTNNWTQRCARVSFLSLHINATRTHRASSFTWRLVYRHPVGTGNSAIYRACTYYVRTSLLCAFRLGFVAGSLRRVPNVITTEVRRLQRQAADVLFVSHLVPSSAVHSLARCAVSRDGEVLSRVRRVWSADGHATRSHAASAAERATR